MKLIPLFVVLATLLSLFSCSNPIANNVTDAEEILIDAQHQSVLSLDSIFEKIDYIKLETTDDNILGPITQILFTDSLLIVVDGESAHTVQVYDLTGKFMYTIGRKGNGPGEYVEVSNVCLVPHKNQIAVLDRAQNRIIYYALDNTGTYVSTENTPFQLIYLDFLESGRKAYYKSGLRDPKFGPFIDNQIIITDSVNEIIYGDCYGIFVPGQFNYTMNRPLRKFNNEVCFSPNFSNVIYTITDSVAIPRYHINIAWNGMPPLNDQITNELFNEYCDKHYIFNGDMIELHDFTYINIMTPAGYPFVVYSHAKKQTFFSSDQGNHPLFPFLKNIAPKARYKDNTVVFDVSAFSLMLNRKELYQEYASDKEWLDELFEGLTEDSNQVILLCHLNKNI